MYTLEGVEGGGGVWNLIYHLKYLWKIIVSIVPPRFLPNGTDQGIITTIANIQTKKTMLCKREP